MSNLEERIMELIRQLREEIRMNDQRIKQLSGGGSGLDLSDLMLKAIYDTNGDNVVDNADKLDGKHASEFAEASHSHTGYGDMLKSVYDQDYDGVVDNAKKIDGRTIYVANRPPESNEGQDGDIWIEYQEV